MSVYAVISSSTNICDNMCVWDGETPWQPPVGHYSVPNDYGAGEIGWHYDPITTIWTPAPTVSASFNPSTITLGDPTVLSWTATNADFVSLSSSPDQSFGISGSQTYTPENSGSFPVVVTATGLAGDKSITVKAKVNPAS